MGIIDNVTLSPGQNVVAPSAEIIATGGLVTFTIIGVEVLDHIIVSSNETRKAIKKGSDKSNPQVVEVKITPI